MPPFPPPPLLHRVSTMAEFSDRALAKNDTLPDDVYSDDSLSTSPDPSSFLVRAQTACHVLFRKQSAINHRVESNCGAAGRSFQ